MDCADKIGDWALIPRQKCLKLTQVEIDKDDIANRNEPAFYCVPAARYADLIDLIEDLELAQIAEERKNEPRIRVNIDEL